MNVKRSVVALAIIFAVSSSYGQTAFATDNTNTAAPAQADAAVAVAPQVPAPAAVSVAVSVTVQQGDNLTLIADSHNTTVADIMSNNNISDPNLIEPGQVLQIQSTTQALAGFSGSLKTAAAEFMTPPPAPATVAQPTSNSSYGYSAPRQARQASSAGNSYTWGTCTWYVKQQIPSLPNQLGNAGNWINSAPAYGYATGSAPAPGAIGVTSGHVVIVSSINPNGTVNISEMNYAGGIGVVHYRTTSAGEFRYIYV